MSMGWMRNGGVRIHSASEVLSSRFGTCGGIASEGKTRKMQVEQLPIPVGNCFKVKGAFKADYSTSFFGL